ncbi:MAG: ankyrin repeat domain-containing protein [Deltaproteobacteria bacterium]|nr:ankyrin repeat domain-containing protein [Deltaproteobacteria bacterium]
MKKLTNTIFLICVLLIYTVNANAASMEYGEFWGYLGTDMQVKGNVVVKESLDKPLVFYIKKESVPHIQLNGAVRHFSILLPDQKDQEAEFSVKFPLFYDFILKFDKEKLIESGKNGYSIIPDGSTWVPELPENFNLKEVSPLIIKTSPLKIEDRVIPFKEFAKFDETLSVIWEDDSSKISVTFDSWITVLDCNRIEQPVTTVISSSFKNQSDANKEQSPNSTVTIKLKVLSESIDVSDITEIKKLIEAGADVDVINKYGATPLWQASWKGHTEVVKLLLETGADI